MQSPTSSRGNQRLAKGVTACQRCRRRKQKCDLKYPNCSNCESAHVLCLTYHSGKQAEIPRNYVSNLEAQVEKLSLENQELRTRLQTNSYNLEATSSIDPLSPTRTGQSPTGSEESTTHFQDLIKSVKNVVVEPSRQPRFLGQSSGITLARLVMAAIRIDSLPIASLTSKKRPQEPSSSYPTSQASLPPRQAAEHLLDVYFQYRTPHLPILERSEAVEAFDSAYCHATGRTAPEGRVVEIDIFTTYLILAIALFDVPNPSGGRPTQSEGCFRSALVWIEKVFAYSRNDIETLRPILLLAQFVALFPSQGSLWHLTGTALRVCIDMGLHWETEDQNLNMERNMLHIRRRLWWSAYQFDRVLCITLGRPFGIIDESIAVPLPDPRMISRESHDSQTNEYDIHHQEAHNHLFHMSKLESEIKHVQHNQAWSPKIAYPRTDYAAWINDILPRLREWYHSIPPLEQSHPSSIFAQQAYWDAIYNNAILQLYRPSATVIHTSAEEFIASFDAACNLIASIKILQREGKVDVLWKSTHQLFMAGLGVIYGLWLSKEIRDQNPVSKSISTLNSCASTLAALSESFPGATGCRDAFDTLSSATVDWLVTQNAEEKQQNRVDFEKQMEDIFRELQPAKDGIPVASEFNFNDMPNMLSTDAFSEMLSSAAQWPDFQTMDFSATANDGSEFWYQTAL
ncbi:hypothetical protein BT63DRAFT_184288 [Microthyrium microscopicum]|uniref:Zn(2)-C6 fungal-type domain-containing protein n=1 Tax=Microthyrium microscopicum TaxID=703497 RepID=A0A6A6ULI9_9PEZI|nr:hypothetical protein BT63DRAFT_184288 [Microthyrium microscopicum]